MQDPKNRAQSGVRVGLEVASSQAMHGGLWRAPFTAATSAFELAIVWYCVNEVQYATVRPSRAFFCVSAVFVSAPRWCEALVSPSYPS